jgi:hypothetical protein
MRMVVPSKIINTTLPSFMFFVVERVVGTTENTECKEKEVTQNIRRYTIIHGNESVTVDVGIRAFVDDGVEYTEVKVINVGKKRKLKHVF